MDVTQSMSACAALTLVPAHWLHTAMHTHLCLHALMITLVLLCRSEAGLVKHAS